MFVPLETMEFAILNSSLICGLSYILHTYIRIYVHFPEALDYGHAVPWRIFSLNKIGPTNTKKDFRFLYLWSLKTFVISHISALSG